MAAHCRGIVQSIEASSGAGGVARLQLKKGKSRLNYIFSVGVL
jgi:hypothetical protein